MLPIASDLAVRATRSQAQSALPQAPVVDDVPMPRRAPRRTRTRTRAARVLRRVADRLEPVQVPEGPLPSG